MDSRSFARISAALLGAGICLTPAIGTAQAAAPQKPAPAVAVSRPRPAIVAKPWAFPRTADGQPDLQGYWNPREVGGSADDVQDGSDYGDVLIMGAEMLPADVIADPPDGKIPYRPEAAAIKEARFKERHNPAFEMRDPTSSRCHLPGVPRQQYLSSFQIVQTRGYVLLLFERQHTYRIIPLDQRPPLNSNIKLWMGDSRGRWEGNTLIVNVTNNNDLTWFDRAGNYHSDALQVVERWTFNQPDRIDYEATMTDPKAYTRPWTIRFHFERNKTPAFELLEEACYEGIQMDQDKYAK
jgi:hypothetical protein